jgi:hypothetical protein
MESEVVYACRTLCSLVGGKVFMYVEYVLQPWFGETLVAMVEDGGAQLKYTESVMFVCET